MIWLLEGSGTSVNKPDMLFSKWAPLGCHYPEGKQSQHLLGPSVTCLSHLPQVLPRDVLSTPLHLARWL